MRSTDGCFRPGAEFARPDVFAGQPLLTDCDPSHYAGLRQRAGFPNPLPAYLHASIRFVISYSRATLAVTLNPLASGCREAIPVSSPLPSLTVRAVTSPVGLQRYHHTLLKGSDGRRSSRLRLSLLGWSRGPSQPACIGFPMPPRSMWLTGDLERERP